MTSVDLLVVAAHPDDAELSLAGTLLVARAQGYRTGILDLTRAELSSRGDGPTREAETAAATRLLELTARENLGLADGDVRDEPRARALLVSALRRLRPRVVLAPWKDDLHPDHAGAGQLLARCDYLGGIRNFAPGEEPHRPDVVGYYMCHTPFRPSVVVDVSTVWARRMEVVECYASQFHRPGVEGPSTKISRPDFLLAVEGRARHYGLLVGAEFGEPVRWENPPRVRDPVGFLGGRAE